MDDHGGLEAVLFDLDGTLVDTAPDMVPVLQAIQQSEGRQPVPYDVARSHVSNGSAGLISLGFPDVSESEHERLRLAYLDAYEGAVCRHSSLFAGFDALLDHLDELSLPWGIVTNKPGYLTDPLLIALELDRRAQCVVSGDTIPQRKPHPAPLLLATRQVGVAPERCVYVGDAMRDIEAGRAAGMVTIAATYGYITDDDDPSQWHADWAAANVEELAHLLAKGVNLFA